jgi:hypothetical protein
MCLRCPLNRCDGALSNGAADMTRYGAMAGSITAVAGMSRVGMLRQHACGRISRVNSSWEISMTVENQSPEARSPVARVRRGAAWRTSRIFLAANAGAAPDGQSKAAEPHAYRQICRPVVVDRPTGDDRALPTSAAAVTRWRAVTATASGLMLKISSLVARGEAGFSGFLLAAASWIAAEVLEGCAAYAEAMYPIALEPPDRLDPADEPKSDIEDTRRAQIIVLRGDRRA